MRGLFCRKAVKSRSLIAGYSFQILVQLTILGEHLSNSMHVKTIIFYYPINHIHHPQHSLLTLCDRRVKQSQTVRGGRFESNLLTLQGRPKHTSRGYSQSHTCNFFLQFPLHGTGPPPSTTEPGSTPVIPDETEVKTVGMYVLVSVQSST